MDQKIHTLDEFLKIRNSFSDNKSVGLITGCFDLLHTGHIDLFQFGKSKVDILIVAIESDESIALTKGNERPIINQNDRAKVLSELNSIDYVVKFLDYCNLNEHEGTKHYNTVTKLINPNYLITSKHGDKYWENKLKRIKSLGGELHLDERERKFSTTSIINRIIERHK